MQENSANLPKESKNSAEGKGVTFNEAFGNQGEESLNSQVLIHYGELL